MKHVKFLIISTLTMLSAINMNAQVADSEVIIDIILIDGKPSLIQMNEEGDVITDFGNVDIYFKTTLTHEQCLEAFKEVFRAEINNLETPSPIMHFALNKSAHTDPILMVETDKLNFKVELPSPIDQQSYLAVNSRQLQPSTDISVSR